MLVNSLIISILFLVIVTNDAKTSRNKSELSSTTDWNWQWFPFNPVDRQSKKTPTKSVAFCDDGVQNIDIDFSPNEKQQIFNYLCITNNETCYQPNLQTQPILTEFHIPAAYQPHTECLSEILNYSDVLPTYGNFRPVSPKFGAYRYLPPQRWLRSLAEGGIVMLYHPCAEKSQRLEMEKYLKACLYRHIISASPALSPEYPFALLAWGKRLEMSVVEREIVIEFIKKNAKNGPLYVENSQVGQLYDAMLLSQAHLTTDHKDTEVCAFNAIQM